MVTKVIGAWPIPDEVFLTLTDDNKITIKDSSITKDKIAFKTIFLEASVEGSGTSVTFTNTSVNDGYYLMIIKAQGVYGDIYINGDTNNSNYYFTNVVGDGSSAYSDTLNRPYLCVYYGVTEVRIYKTINNQPKIIYIWHEQSGGNYGDLSVVGINYSSSVSDITQIDIVFTASTNYKIYLYKVMY